MATAIVYEKDGTESGKMELPEKLFGGEVNQDVIHEAVVAYLANQRQGTASTKGRSDVRGGGHKPYRQKGTGRARAGTTSSPVFRGGGVVFGPHPRDYSRKLPKKVKRLALVSSLSSRANDGDIVVIKSLEMTEPKTKEFAGILANIDVAGKKMLVVVDRPNEATIKSARNIPRIKMMQANMVSTYDVMWADKIVLTASAVERMEEVFAS
ncbi:MAG: 50S ribosomal protein L4 [Candidatus Krumholzibacteria bacterium]|nr:50S ribosomal protein L4 [Candidatus Krumholzibacteria bacterium]